MTIFVISSILSSVFLLFLAYLNTFMIHPIFSFGNWGNNAPIHILNIINTLLLILVCIYRNKIPDKVRSYLFCIPLILCLVSLFFI